MTDFHDRLLDTLKAFMATIFTVATEVTAFPAGRGPTG